jgi:hypothetical protein
VKERSSVIKPKLVPSKVFVEPFYIYFIPSPLNIHHGNISTNGKFCSQAKPAPDKSAEVSRLTPPLLVTYLLEYLPIAKNLMVILVLFSIPINFCSGP